MLDQFGILTEFKVTGSAGRSTPPAAIHRDLRKLGLFAAAHQNAGGSNPMATYMVVLDNHHKLDSPSAKYRSERMSSLLERVTATWSPAAPRPIVLVGNRTETDRYVLG